MHPTDGKDTVVALFSTSDLKADYNLNYIKTISGLMKVAEIALGFVMLVFLSTWKLTCEVSWSHFLQMTAFTYFVMTTLLLLSLITSSASHSFMASGIGMNFHMLAVLLFSCASIAALVDIPHNDQVSIPAILASVLAVFNIVLYLADSILIHKNKY